MSPTTPATRAGSHRSTCLMPVTGPKQLQLFEDGELHALSAMLSKLGATPTDESKVTHPNSDEDPDEAFFH